MLVVGESGFGQEFGLHLSSGVLTQFELRFGLVKIDQDAGAWRYVNWPAVWGDPLTMDLGRVVWKGLGATPNSV